MKLNECIYFLTTRLSRELKKVFDRKLERLGLTSAMWCVLMVIVENKEINQKEISEYLSIETPTVTKILDNLAKRDYIQRLPDESDRRAFKVVLTQKGNEVKEELTTLGECFMATVKRDLTEEEKEIVKKLLNKLYLSVKSL
jgi:MarR family transcriptional regulator for hemolysin